MVMLGDQAWGCIWEDGYSTSYGWMDPCRAPIHDPRYCRKVTDVTYRGSHYIRELSKGRLVKVKRTTKVEVEL